tara:strand:+ start:3735 stop:4832 length:1098 start_codon:yes stop_codon:yes gene_type:complete
MNIAINGTCINAIESGAKNRFKSIYNNLISSNPNLQFYILEPSDYEISNLISKKKNLTFVKTECLSYNSIQRYIVGIKTIPSIIKKYNIEIYEQSHLPLINLSNVKIIFTIHDIRYSNQDLGLNYFLRPSFISNFFLKAAIKKADQIITVSKTIEKEVNKIIKTKKTNVIYNPLKFSIYNEDLKEYDKNSIDLHKNTNHFLCVGSFEKRKNYEIILYSAYLLKNVNINFKFTLVGFRTKYIFKLNKIIKNLGLSNHINIHHNLTNSALINLYKKCDIFIYPSKYEGFGIPLIEAINFNCNIILSDIKVFREITDNNGQFFDPNSPEDLTYKIIECLVDKSKFKIDKKILNKYQISNITKSILNLY